jgi:hypothetical protein
LADRTAGLSDDTSDAKSCEFTTVKPSSSCLINKPNIRNLQASIHHFQRSPGNDLALVLNEDRRASCFAWGPGSREAARRPPFSSSPGKTIRSAAVSVAPTLRELPMPSAIPAMIPAAFVAGTLLIPVAIQCRQCDARRTRQLILRRTRVE